MKKSIQDYRKAESVFHSLRWMYMYIRIDSESRQTIIRLYGYRAGLLFHTS